MTNAAWWNQPDGCDWHPVCLTCPLPKCRVEYRSLSDALRAWTQVDRQREHNNRSSTEAAKAVEIADEVMLDTGISIHAMLGPYRMADVTTARHIAIQRVRRETMLSGVQIAWLFRRDHSTITHVLLKVGIRLREGKRVDQRAEVAA